MKKTIFVFSCLFFSALMFADIRDAVCIVEPQYSEKSTGTIKKAYDDLNVSGYSTLAKAFKDLELNAFGSGFFYRAPNNQIYVVTNAHVVSDADIAKITIDPGIGEKRVIENCNVVAVSADFDLALLSLPPNTKIAETIPLMTKRPQDGDDVWSAGYPGLGEKPAWQLARGSVTNRMAKIDELVESEKMVLIQHSAPIDGGNSGGPLVVKANNSVGFVVVAINTWKAFFRDSTNFAVPVEALEKFVNTAVVKNNANIKKAQLYNRIQDVCKLATKYNRKENSDERSNRIHKMQKYISDSFVNKDGGKVLIAALDKGTDGEYITKKSIGLLGAPLDLLRLVLGIKLENELYSYKDKPAITREEFDKMVKLDGDTASIEFVLDEKKVVLTFDYAKYDWFIKDCTVNEIAVADKWVKEDVGSFGIKTPYKTLLFVGYDLELNKDSSKTSAFNLGGLYSTKFVSFGGFIGFGINHNKETSPSTQKMPDIRMGGILRGQVAFRLSRKLDIIPYFDAKLSMRNSKYKESFGFFGYFGPGVQLKVNTSTRFVVFAQYNYFLNFKNTEENGHAIGLGVGFPF